MPLLTVSTPHNSGDVQGRDVTIGKRNHYYSGPWMEMMTLSTIKGSLVEMELRPLLWKDGELF